MFQQTSTNLKEVVTLVKDLLKSLNSIHNDNKLSLEEKFLLTILIKYHNHKLNYAYPSYEVLMAECSTNRKAKISKIVKSLSQKEYITIKKSQGNKNLYFINKHLYYIAKDESTDSKEQKQLNKIDTKKAPKVGVVSNGNEPLPNQVTIAEALQEAESKESSLEEQIVEATGCTKEIAKSSVAYAKQQGANNIKAYAIASINKGFTGSNLVNGINPLKFNNFESREYDYDSLEKKLLGWDNTNLEEVEEIQESTGYDFLKKYGIGSAIAN